MRLYPIIYSDASDTAAHTKQLRGLGRIVAVIVKGAHTADVVLTANGETVFSKTGVGSAGGTTFYPAALPTKNDGTAITNAYTPIVVSAGASFSCTLANGTASEAFTVTVVVDHN